jgi:acyl-CoA dehydrogenase
MTFFIFPRALVYSAPSDALGRKVARIVSSSTDARERLCEHIYWTLEPGNPLGLLQEALLLAEAVEPLEKRIRVDGVKTGKVTALDLPGQIQQSLAGGLLSDSEAAALREYDRKIMDLINVDDFAPREIAMGAQQPQPQPRTSAQLA